MSGKVVEELESVRKVEERWKRHQGVVHEAVLPTHSVGGEVPQGTAELGENIDPVGQERKPSMGKGGIKFSRNEKQMWFFLLESYQKQIECISRFYSISSSFSTQSY